MLSVLLACTLAAADWLSASADPKHTRSQPAEKELSAVTAANLKLLWKFSFEERVTAPVVLGPIFTHRGIKELVFIAGANDNLYSIDADLGRLFWKRHFEVAASDCKTGLTATPVLAPYNGPAPEGDDASTPRRSLFVLTSDGQLHTVRPADAKDLSLPEPFLPAGSVASDLTLTSRVVTTYVSDGCGRPQIGEYGHVLNAAGAPFLVKPGPAPGTLPPVTANGLTFAASGSQLIVTETATRKQIFRSASNGTEPAQDSLAIANGHVYFVAGKTLYCYGFPIEI